MKNFPIIYNLFSKKNRTNPKKS